VQPVRIGVDVGGTNTDAVLMDGRRIVAWHKTATTADVSSGIITALREVLSAGSCRPRDVGAVMIGTTHFTNAVVERKRLLEVAAIRVALPATQALPPMIDWPADLRDAVGNHVFYVHGGYEFNGRQISPVDEDEITKLGTQLRELSLSSAAITSVFSPVNGDQERRVADILRAAVPGLSISLSSEIGRIGLLERENATIMNASLTALAIGVVSSFRTALDQIGIDAPFYISQNDGTLMKSEFAERYPILTFISGPTNSMRGAAFLSGLRDAIVVDIGGTTSDIGALVGGFPREAAAEVEIAQVRTNFRMPDVVSIGLGGGSIIRQNGGLTVGPDSVGYALTARGLAFGGDTLTATDIAVAAGQAQIGDPELVQHVDSALIEQARTQIHAIIERSIDRIKLRQGAVPVVLVGGGTILLGESIPGASEIIKPEYAAVANAIGAAIAQVGGEVDRVFSLEGTTRDQVLAAARQDAADQAIDAGAQPGTVQIVEVDEIPLTYLPGNAIRIRVKAVGDLELTPGTDT
jgi:N-methylhydantoinase A/oxoprolinase/acetone carboxylase beta subunit